MIRDFTAINVCDRDWTRHRYVLWFGACAPTYLMVWANSLEDAIEGCAAWIDEQGHVGLFCDEVVEEGYERAIADGMDVDSAWEHAEIDTFPCDGGHYLASEEWGIVFEDPTREQVLEWQGRDPLTGDEI